MSFRERVDPQEGRYLREGLTYEFSNPPQYDTVTAERLRQDRLFDGAMAAAKVQVHGSGNAPPFPNREPFVIVVGPRPITDADLRELEEERERALRLIRGETD